MTKEDNHEFGGNWTVIKLELLERYLKAFNTALQASPSPTNRFKRIYIDAFAGTGKCSVSINGENLDIDGSAKIALEAQPPFDELYFIDLKRKHVKALTQLANDHDKRDIKILGGDCNDQIDTILKGINWRGSRAVMFLDPYGMSVNWETLQRISATKAIDLWYLFPLNAVCRQAANRFEKIDEKKSASLTRLFGTSTWKDDFYQEVGQADFLREDQDNPQRQRQLDQNQIQKYAQDRLKILFPVVLDPVQLPEQGSPLFSLFFMSSNPSEKAMSLTKGIVGHLLNLKTTGKLKASKKESAARPTGPDLFK